MCVEVSMGPSCLGEETQGRFAWGSGAGAKEDFLFLEGVRPAWGAG